MRYRLTRIEDLPHCVELVHNSFVDRPDIRRAMPQIWGSLLRRQSLTSAVIEGHGNGRIEAVFLGVFVREEFIDEVLEHPHPRVVLNLYENILAGASPVLGPEAVREANSTGGLNCLILHTGARPGGGSNTNRRLSESLRDLCVLLYSGYRIKRVVEEVVGSAARIAMEQSGFRLVTDFADYYRNRQAPAPNDHPYLFVVSANDVVPGIVSGVSFYFNTDAPRFDFAPVQQQVLLHALFNESDEEIATSLAISVETVRKHWRSIYRHVMERDPTFFPSNHHEGDTRGPEKRRYLLSFVRMHLDEIRPRERRRRPRIVPR